LRAFLARTRAISSSRGSTVSMRLWLGSGKGKCFLRFSYATRVCGRAGERARGQRGYEGEEERPRGR